MVKSLVGDEAQLKAFEDNLFASAIGSVQVGLVVGKLSPDSDRGLVYALLPTPPTDFGAPACALGGGGGGGTGGGRKGGSKGGKASAAAEVVQPLVLDGDWVAEHARQVSRMLLGGMSVIGIYLWASEASLKVTTPATISQVVRAVARAAPLYDSGFDERLLVQISHSPRRWACRICETGSGGLRPCDFKYSKLIASLQAFRCTYNFGLRLPIVQAEPFKKVILRAINRLAKEVQSAKALINGNLLKEDLSISSEGPHNVEFLVPFSEDVSAEDCSLEGVTGLVLFSGSVSASAYLASKDSLSQAISDLKDDIVASLRSRLDVILDEAEGAATSSDNANDDSGEAATQTPVHQFVLHELREPIHFAFPRRVLVPWLAGVLACDYLQPSESLEDTFSRCRELLSTDAAAAEGSEVLELETVATSASVRQFWDVANAGAASAAAPVAAQPKQVEDRRAGLEAGRNVRGGRFNILAALFFLLLAVLAGLLFSTGGSR